MHCEQYQGCWGWVFTLGSAHLTLRLLRHDSERTGGNRLSKRSTCPGQTRQVLTLSKTLTRVLIPANTFCSCGDTLINHFIPAPCWPAMFLPEYLTPFNAKAVHGVRITNLGALPIIASVSLTHTITVCKHTSPVTHTPLPVCLCTSDCVVCVCFLLYLCLSVCVLCATAACFVFFPIFINTCFVLHM